jgi:hypothetical protein
MSTTRYYKIEKGTETFKKLEALWQRVHQADLASKKLALELGSDGTTLYLTSYIGGGIIGYKMGKLLPGWKKLRGYSEFYFPKAIKANHEILKRIRTLPAIPRIELSRIVGYDSRFGAPGVQLFGNHFLVEMTIGSSPDSFYGQCEPTPDMIEITGFEYLTLLKEK